MALQWIDALKNALVDARAEYPIPSALKVALTIVGGICISSYVLSGMKLFFSTFVVGGKNLRKYGKPGTWAVVTGASDGLGKEFATQLASKGFNLVLVSRTASKLEALAAELEKKFAGKNLKTKVVSMDYSQDRDEDYQKLAREIEGLDIGVLINNVGQSHSIPVPFLETDANELQNIVTINCLGTLKTTRVIAPIMVRRGNGLILTLGSFAGWTPTPYLATYSGSKAFLQHWSTSLAAELKPQGVDVNLVLSYLVATAMSKIRRTSMMIPGPRDFVKATLSKIGSGGYQIASSTYTPYWSHAVFLWIVEKTVGPMSPTAVNINLKMHKDIRRRALRKAEREAKKN
ncbi:probable Very-long-chain 3-oxoacyl-CoA reductase [Cephalotrichum gorgonifer]|uniref:Very-long-chain 3-oxoacyl-CoA reductase n=1 Tax=Cephalotrichum gorgonifer TaxID=2041049 RepID=A0AAE8MS07_9PEZI|nr:probable Very-long-chain 3-oxoacyl-CoA reductase [Cephalotrichum gorgonifer]